MPDSEDPTQDASPARAATGLRFSVDTLREAGESLGQIESSLTPPKTTFEELIERARELRDRVAARERGAA